MQMSDRNPILKLIIYIYFFFFSPYTLFHAGLPMSPMSKSVAAFLIDGVHIVEPHLCHLSDAFIQGEVQLRGDTTEQLRTWGLAYGRNSGRLVELGFLLGFNLLINSLLS